MNLIVTKVCNDYDEDKNNDGKKNMSVTNNSLVNFLHVWQWRWIHAFHYSIFIFSTSPKTAFMHNTQCSISVLKERKEQDIFFYTKHTVKQINEWMLWKEHTFKHIILNKQQKKSLHMLITLPFSPSACKRTFAKSSGSFVVVIK